jgi:hypothetical protein
MTAPSPAPGADAPRLPLLGIAVVLALALLAGLFVAFKPSLLPPQLSERPREFAVAKTQVLVDTPRSAFVDGSQDPRLPSNLAMTYALFLRSDAATAEIGRSLGLPTGSIAGSGPFTELVDRDIVVRSLPTAAAVNPQDRKYRIVLDVYGDRPILTIYGQAPTPAAAGELVEATVATLQRHVVEIQDAANVPSDVAATLRPLGLRVGGVVNKHVNLEFGMLAFLLVGGAGAAILYRRERRRRGPPARRAAAREPSMAPGQDDWPHTTRLLPWSLAAFAVMIFLVPFDAISLPIPIPMDGKLDRPLLLGVAMLWIGSLVVLKGPAAPRVFIGRIHVAALVFLALACLGVALNATALINLGEFTLSLKKLVLLGSYVVLLFVVASVLRPSEVKPFVMLMIGLAVLLAIGTIVEYRTDYNVFYEWSAKLLPGSIDIPSDLHGRDSIGRVTVYGSGGHPLEVATLLGMAMPFALVELLRSGDMRRKLWFGLAVAILVAGALATVRKTAVVAPMASVLVLAAYRPRLVVRRLLPMGLVLLLLVSMLTPGAAGSILNQLTNANNVRTTQDRTADYDGVAPDVTSHLLMGRGFQSYDHNKYRILDNEYLGLIVGVGALGLIAYLAMIVATMSAAHRPIMGRDPTRAQLALACSGAIAVFAVATLLFDILARAHVAYLFFLIGGLVAVLRAQQAAPDPHGRAVLRARPHAPRADRGGRERSAASGSLS